MENNDSVATPSPFGGGREEIDFHYNMVTCRRKWSCDHVTISMLALVIYVYHRVAFQTAGKHFLRLK